MTKIERYLAAKADAAAVRAALAGAESKVLVDVDAIREGSGDAHIVFAFGGAVMNTNIARSIVKGVKQNLAAILTSAMAAADARAEEARLAAVAEANEVLQVAQP